MTNPDDPNYDASSVDRFAASQDMSSDEFRRQANALKARSGPGCSGKLSLFSGIGLLFMFVVILLSRRCGSDSPIDLGGSTVPTTSVVVTPATVSSTTPATTTTLPPTTTTTESTTAPTTATTTVVSTTIAAASADDPCSLVPTNFVRDEVGQPATAEPSTGANPGELVCVYTFPDAQPLYVITRRPVTAEDFAGFQTEYAGTADTTLGVPAFRSGTFLAELVGDVFLVVDQSADTTNVSPSTHLDAVAAAAAAAL
ncbi:MAG: hypothetical protein JWN62_678 [Acidimicrobiales bacterium]|nr:hypothetical protein [Acidimicrobiales bacterium]